MARYFTLTECEALLPKVERALRDAVFQKAEYQKAEEELESSTRQIRMAGGSRVNRGEYISLQACREGTSAAALKESP